MYPYVFPVAGSSTPWKATAPSPTAPTAWLEHVRENRGYLWGGLVFGDSTLSGVSGSGLGVRHCGTTGNNLRVAWGAAFPQGVGKGVAERVRLRGGVGVGVGVPDTEKNCLIVEYCP